MNEMNRPINHANDFIFGRASRVIGRILRLTIDSRVCYKSSSRSVEPTIPRFHEKRRIFVTCYTRGYILFEKCTRIDGSLMDNVTTTVDRHGIGIFVSRGFIWCDDDMIHMVSYYTHKETTLRT